MQPFYVLMLGGAIALGAVAPIPAQARDTRLLLPISAALQQKDRAEKTSGTVQFFFADQPVPDVRAAIGSDVSNRKTNAFGKEDVDACNWVFLSALISLEKRAQELGANAVVNIVSYYHKQEMSSRTLFECHAGAIMAGVALKADFVKIGR